MQIFYLLIFCFGMLPAALLTTLLAARSWPWLLWNFAWFMLMAKVGSLAFDSYLGSYPALVLAFIYAYRASRAQSSLKQFGVQFFTDFIQKQQRQARSPEEGIFPQKTRVAKEDPDVIEAEFRRQPDFPKG